MNETLKAPVSYYAFPGIKENRHLRIRINEIVNDVCDFFNVDREDIFSEDKAKETINDARKAVTYLCFKFLKMNKSELGRVFNRDHTTIIFRLQAAKDFIDTDPVFATAIRHLSKKLIA